MNPLEKMPVLDVVSRWHGLLWATSRDLAPQKSYWYLVELHWKSGQWHYKTVKEAPGELWLPGSLSPIERQEVTSPAEALGILSHPDGSMANEVSHLQSKVLHWAEQL